MNKHKIVAISGSTRQQSSNHNLIKAIQKIYAEKLDIVMFEGLGNLPQFNPDHNNELTPATVLAFRKMLQDADGVLICTPEYAHGVPGALKNAIDWTVSSAEFSQKPTALITASTDGQFGHKALLETLRVIEAKNIEQQQMVISFIATKVDASLEIKDADTKVQVDELMKVFIRTIEL